MSKTESYARAMIFRRMQQIHDNSSIPDETRGTTRRETWVNPPEETLPPYASWREPIKRRHVAGDDMPFEKAYKYFEVLLIFSIASFRNSLKLFYNPRPNFRSFQLLVAMFLSIREPDEIELSVSKFFLRSFRFFARKPIS